MISLLFSGHFLLTHRGLPITSKHSASAVVQAVDTLLRHADTTPGRTGTYAGWQSKTAPNGDIAQIRMFTGDTFTRLHSGFGAKQVPNLNLLLEWAKNPHTQGVPERDRYLETLLEQPAVPLDIATLFPPKTLAKLK